MSAPTIVRAAALANVSHAFLGRPGGVSTGIYASLNVGIGSEDDPTAVRENRRRGLATLPGADALLTVRQVHGARAVAVGAPIADKDRVEADAMVTRTPGLALGILTADCAPVLLADARAGVIGAAHAGWKGALGGVLEAVVACMEEFGADRSCIAAAIGPCIAQASYEVTDAFLQTFATTHLGPVAPWFAPGTRPGHHQFALEAFVADRLRAAGIAVVEPLGLDTYPDPARWFSYRRATHARERDYGRQLSLIALR